MKSAIVSIWYFVTVSLWIVSLVMFTVAREFVVVNQAIFAAALVLTFALIFYKRKQAASLVKNPYFSKAVSSGIRVFLILCVFGMVNYLAVKTSRSVDLTSSKLHTLSEQSKTVAKSVNEDLTITLFAKRADWERFLPLLRQYENESNNISIKAVDVDENPSLVKLNDVKENGAVIFETQGRKIKGKASSELELTNLLLKSMRAKKPVVYYTVGHGELDRSDEEDGGASFLFGVIDNGSYDLRPLDTLKSGGVPADADAVMVLGPSQGLMKSETKILSSYLGRGGNVFILLGPNFKEASFKNLKEMMAKRGVRHHNALVLDRLSAVQGANATIPIVNRFHEGHAATKNFSGRALFPLSAALKEEKVEEITYTALATSSPFPASWAESQLKDINSGKVYYNKGLDLKGPVALLAVSESSKDYGKMAVSSSVDFVSNAYQNQSSNFNLFLNTLSWLMDDEGIISLNRPALSDNMIILSASQISLIFYFSILFMPFAFFGFAVWIYRKRMHK